MSQRNTNKHDDLAARMAVLDAVMQTLLRDNEQLRAKIGELEQREAPPPVTRIALKAAIPPGLNYETARHWCERGYVTAEKRGGRWFVAPESLRVALASRLPGGGLETEKCGNGAALFEIGCSYVPFFDE